MEQQGCVGSEEPKPRRCCGLPADCRCLAGLGLVSACCAVALAILLYGPSALLRELLRLVPREPGWQWHAGLAAATALSIVTLLPVWPPLCMAAGLLFGVCGGTAVNFAALVGAAHASIALGRCFLREPIRGWLEAQDYQRVQRMMLVLEDNEDSLKFQVLFRFLVIPMFVRNYGPSTLQIPLWKLSLSTLPHSAWASFLFASLGASFADVAQLLREGKELDLRALKWQQALLFAVSLSVALLLTLYAHHKYKERLEREGALAAAPGPAHGPPDARA